MSSWSCAEGSCASLIGLPSSFPLLEGVAKTRTFRNEIEMVPYTYLIASIISKNASHDKHIKP